MSKKFLAFASLTLTLVVLALAEEQSRPTDVLEKEGHKSTEIDMESILVNESKGVNNLDYNEKLEETETNTGLSGVDEETLEVFFNVETNLDYVLDEKFGHYSFLEKLCKEREMEELDRRISLYGEGYDELLLKDVLAEEERSRREYYRLEKPIVAVDIEQLESRVFARGNVLFGVSYGTVKKLPDITVPVYSFIKENFNVNQDMRVYSASKIGNKVNVDIEFDQKSAINKFNVSYKEPESKAFDDSVSSPVVVSSFSKTQEKTSSKPFVRELTFGEVSFSKQPSKYISYTAIAQSAQGVKFVGKKDDISLEVIGTLATTVPAKRTFTGTKKISERIIKDIDFVKRKFFKLPDSRVDVGSVTVLVSIPHTETPEVYIDGIPFRKLIQGVEYLFDAFTDEIELKYNLERNRFLAIFYTHNSGKPITFSTNIYRGLGSDGREYLYLFNPDVGYSPYELKNIYSLGTLDINLSYGLEITVYYTFDPTISAPFHFLPSDYYVDVSKGVIRFVSPTPFLSNANYNIYSLPRDPLESESTYTMKIKYYESVISYQLDFDIIENSEEVRVNGVIIPKDKYTIIYPIGRIVFKDPTLINEGDKVEISYEHRPFFGGSQKISLGAVMEYQPISFSTTRASMAFWTSQGRGTAPTIGTSTPEVGLITSIVNRIDFKEMFNTKNDKLVSYLDVEYAFSVVNPNSFGSAIVEDFEGNKKSLLLSKDEDSWYLSSHSPTDSCYNTNRGKLYYKDYRRYYANEAFTLMSFSWELPDEQILPYSQKPGPYIASGGRLNVVDFPNVPQFSLVFDYDFSEGEWVGAMLLLSSSGLDLSDLEEIIVSYKLQMDNDRDNHYDDINTNKLHFLFQIGRFSEDLDGDNRLDYEVTTSQNGFEFNSSLDGSVVTRVGGGRKGGGNNKIDSEDLDKNGRLDTNESFVSFSNVIEGSGWKQLVISARSPMFSQTDALKRASMVRLIFKKQDGIKGRVIIDEVQFKFRTTPVYKVDGVILSDPYQIKSTSISVYDSPLYLKNRFFNLEARTPEEKERLQEYSHLHGTSGMSVSEAKSIDEASVRITYNLSNSVINTNVKPYQGGREGVAVIRFNASQNFSHYSKLIMYLFVPTKNELGQPIKQAGDTLSDESVVIRLVTKEKDYFEFAIPFDILKKDEWNRLEIRIREDYKLLVNNDIYNTISPKIVGFPSIRDINSLEFGVRVNEGSLEPVSVGEVWFNEVFLTGANWYLSSAVNSLFNFSYKGGFELFNFPIISNLYATLTVENLFPNFKGMGGKENINTFMLTHFYSSELLKYFDINSSFSLTKENSVADPSIPEYLVYDQIARAFRYSVATKHSISFLPSLSYSFSERQLSSSKNGLTTIGTNTLLQKIMSEDVGLDSSMSASYSLPFLEKYFTLRNKLTLSSTYSAKNNQAIVNDVLQSPLPSYQNWIYSLSLDTSFNYSSISINNTFSHSETFNITETNPIPFVDEISKSSIPQRNHYSLTLLAEGFKERGNRREVYEANTLSLSFANLLNTANVYITPMYEFKDFNFNYISNRILRDSQMRGKVTYKLDFNVNRFIVSSVSLSSSLNTTFSVNSVEYELRWYDFYTNNLYRGVVAIPFYEYSGLFGYENLSNALALVSTLKNTRSIVNMFVHSGITVSLLPADDLILSFVPRNYSFDYSTSTTRELSSYRQSTRMVITATSYIPVYKLGWFIFRRDTSTSVNDLSLGVSFTKDEDFNSLTVRNKLDLSSSLSGIVANQQNFSASYILSYSYQDVITNLPNFYSNFGIGLVPPYSLLSQVSHNVKLSYSHGATLENDLDLWITKIRAKSVVENKEEVNLYLEYPWYNTNAFQSFKRRVFDFNFYHESSVNFSEFIRFSGYLKLLLAQISEVYVENNEVKEKFFDIIPGVEVGINLRVTF